MRGCRAWPEMLVARMRCHEPWWAEWWSATGSLAWCIAVAILGGLKSFHGYEALTIIAPPWFWYTFSITAPIGQIWALGCGRKTARWWMAFIMAWWWSFLCWSVVFDGALRVSMAFYPVFTALNVVSMIHLFPWRR